MSKIKEYIFYCKKPTAERNKYEVNIFVSYGTRLYEFSPFIALELFNRVKVVVYICFLTAQVS